MLFIQTDTAQFTMFQKIFLTSNDQKNWHFKGNQ